jgi:ADP-ribosylglycohydrolase
MLLADKIKGCFYGGAIGDCMGAAFENSKGGYANFLENVWHITDDTQLTLATIQSITQQKKADPAHVAQTYVAWFNNRKITGIGSSTLKALQELQVGGHWALAGRQGEHAAGNGAAMRIAPLAFMRADRQLIQDVCRITHRNDEAYVGALAVVECISAVLTGGWDGGTPLISIVAPQLPDTRLRDRLFELLQETAAITSVSKKYGNTGYVVHSVPLAIYAAQKVLDIGFEGVMTDIITGGGDTDTICSIAGQIMGTLIGYGQIPAALTQRLGRIREYAEIENLVAIFIQMAGQTKPTDL